MVVEIRLSDKELEKLRIEKKLNLEIEMILERNEKPISKNLVNEALGFKEKSGSHKRAGCKNPGVTGK